MLNKEWKRDVKVSVLAIYQSMSLLDTVRPLFLLLHLIRRLDQLRMHGPYYLADWI